MSDLGADTAIEGGDGHYEGRLSRDWEIWGPQGGYLASFALRAAGAHCEMPRPASLVGHFLGVANFDRPLTIDCATLRVARTARSTRVSVSQDDQPIFEALVWGVTSPLTGLTHNDVAMPGVAHWSDLMTIEERLAAMGETFESWYPFWNNFDQRPPHWRNDWNEREPGSEPPIWQQWLRYRAADATSDPWLDACRLLILVDVGSWPAAQALHNTAAVMAPSIDLACEFHQLDPDAEWLFVQGHAPHAGDALVASHQHVWNDRGELLASGISQLLCRPTTR